MIKEDYKEIIAKVVCGKSEKITCDECYLIEKGKICVGYNQCRISEKTKEQLEYIITPKEENTFLKACAGSGKTEVVGLKTAFEMKQWKSYNQGIAVLTFTNEATDVIFERVKQFTGRSNTYPHYIGTLSSFIHSYIVQPFAYKICGFKGKKDDFSFCIIDSNISIHGNQWLNSYKCKIQYIDSKGDKHPIYAHQIGYDKNKSDYYFYIGKYKKIEWLHEYYFSERVQKFIEEERKKYGSFYGKIEYYIKCFEQCKTEFWKSGFVTFDDMNYLASEIMSQNDIGVEIAKRFPYIFIDECQDLSGNELSVIQRLQECGCKVHLIGDLNQSIYEFKRVEPNEINEYVKDFNIRGLNVNFRSCKEIVEFSEKLIDSKAGKSANEKSVFGKYPLVYIEYEKQEDCIAEYVKLLKKHNFMDKENRILVRQNSVRLQLEKSTHDDYDEKEPLMTGLRLWQNGSQQHMKYALELVGRQISIWFGGGGTKINYYCPNEITSVFKWRIFIMNVLNEMQQSEKLSDVKLTCGKWHEYARNILNDILKNNYLIIADYDDVKDRNFTKLVNGNNFRVSIGNSKLVIDDLDSKEGNNISIMTIHGSKGCTFDTTLVISSDKTQSKGGHWKEHWLNGEGENKRIGYVASTRAKYLLVWGGPKLDIDDKKLIESYGFVNIKDII